MAIRIWCWCCECIIKFHCFSSGIKKPATDQYQLALQRRAQLLFYEYTTGPNWRHIRANEAAKGHHAAFTRLKLRAKPTVSPERALITRDTHRTGVEQRVE